MLKISIVKRHKIERPTSAISCPYLQLKVPAYEDISAIFGGAKMPK